MPQHRATAAAYVRSHARELELIIGELVESATLVGSAWAEAVDFADADPLRSLNALAAAEVRLTHHIRREALDSLRVIRSAMDRFDRELPDTEDTTDMA